MSIWEEFSDDELYIVLECDSLSEIKRKFRRKFNRERWLAYARSYYELTQTPKFDPERFFLSINEGSVGVLTLLGIIGSITVALIPLSIIAPILCVTTFISSIIFYIIAYREGKNKSQQTVKDYDLLALKIQCANEIIQRKHKILASSPGYRGEISAMRQIYRDNEFPAFTYKSKSDKVSPTLKFGMFTSSLLFGTYYCGLAILLNAFGVLAISATMLGVIGVSVAIGVAIGIGIFCAYKRYRAIVAQEHLDQFKEYQQTILKDLRYECHHLQREVNTVSIESSHRRERRVTRSLSAPNTAFFSAISDNKQHQSPSLTAVSSLTPTFYK